MVLQSLVNTSQQTEREETLMRFKLAGKKKERSLVLRKRDSSAASFLSIEMSLLVYSSRKHFSAVIEPESL